MGKKGRTRSQKRRGAGRKDELEDGWGLCVCVDGATYATDQYWLYIRNLRCPVANAV